jgi:hypothetical protein
VTDSLATRRLRAVAALRAGARMEHAARGEGLMQRELADWLSACDVTVDQVRYAGSADPVLVHLVGQSAAVVAPRQELRRGRVVYLGREFATASAREQFHAATRSLAHLLQVDRSLILRALADV